MTRSRFIRNMCASSRPISAFRATWCNRQRQAQNRSMMKQAIPALVSDLVVGSAIAASFARLLAGKLIALHLPQEQETLEATCLTANKKARNQTQNRLGKTRSLFFCVLSFVVSYFLRSDLTIDAPRCKRYFFFNVLELPI